MNRSDFDLVVVSHLRWGFVWQRPQQLLSRLAQHRRVIFIEEPEYREAVTTQTPSLKEVCPNVHVLTPRVDAEKVGDEPLWLWPAKADISRQVQAGLRSLDVRKKVLWFYTPTPEFFAESLCPDMVVYDVMDELANFKFAPPELREREARLLQQSAAVFTGGASLYDAKKGFNRKTFLFPSGVDCAHYAKAQDTGTTLPDWMESIPEPRAVYIGVIDERLDYEVIAKTAEAHPDVQFVYCGPVVKVDPATLPQAPNLHYPGQQAYADLPRILKGAQVCLMPFAQNEATRFISPTKTLEYMASDRPIVSAPIKDVERFYSDLVFLATTPEHFAAQVKAALNEAPQSRKSKRRKEATILAQQAWDVIAAKMNAILETEWKRRKLSVSGAAELLPARLSKPGTAPMISLPVNAHAFNEGN